MTRPERSKRSLRGILTLWFLALSVIPLGIVSFYSSKLYEKAINDELQKRLEGNIREVGVNLGELENYLYNYGKIHAEDPTLSYHVATRNIASARRVVTEWLKTYSASRIVLFDSDGRLVVSETRLPNSQMKSQTNLESGDVFLPEKLMQQIREQSHAAVREVQNPHGLNLIVYTSIKQKGRVVGFLEEVIELGQSFTAGLKKRLNLDAVIFDDQREAVVSSNENFLHFAKDFYPGQIGADGQGFFNLQAANEPYGMMVRKIIDNKGVPFVTLGLAASKKDSQRVLERINYGLLSITLLVLLLLIPALIYVTNRVVKPINELVEATQKIESGGRDIKLSHTSDTELGILINSFNKMARNISSARKELEKEVREVEKTNKELKNTQTSLVHSAKMASLGQLVAGVAHELNNPIGFIYSNMSHLREYVDKLKKVLKAAEENPEKLEKVKKEVDFDYLIEDLPKLIASCEDGARRTREIVVGLRNFSRLDEASLKQADLHEGLRNTLKLLNSELKNRIKVHEDYGRLPEVRCYVSQLNQVFMNIISNASQAIKGDGEIWIKTWTEGDWACVSIRDSGPGIPIELRDKIFDPFFTTKPVGHGTGLGLSISYGIIQKHGGDIEMKFTKEGKGTEFVIRVPVAGPPDIDPDAKPKKN